MAPRLTPEVRTVLLDSLKALEKDHVAAVRFYAAVVRASFGERPALALAAAAASDPAFFIDTVKSDYESLMKQYNDSRPDFGRIMPFYWDENE